MCSSVNNDYYELLLEKTAEECSNGDFYENANWREKVLSIFEKYSVRRSLNEANIFATPEKEVISRTKEDMDTTAESTDGNDSNEISIFVPETQVDPSQRPHSVLSNDDDYFHVQSNIYESVTNGTKNPIPEPAEQLMDDDYDAEMSALLWHDSKNSIDRSEICGSITPDLEILNSPSSSTPDFVTAESVPAPAKLTETEAEAELQLRVQPLFNNNSSSTEDNYDHLESMQKVIHPGQMPNTRENDVLASTKLFVQPEPPSNDIATPSDNYDDLEPTQMFTHPGQRPNVRDDDVLLLVRTEPPTNDKETPTDNYDDLEPTQMFIPFGQKPNAVNIDILEPSKILVRPEQMRNNTASPSDNYDDLEPTQVFTHPGQRPNARETGVLSVRTEPPSNDIATPTDNYDDLEPTQMFIHSGQKPNARNKDLLESSKGLVRPVQKRMNTALPSDNYDELEPTQMFIHSGQMPNARDNGVLRATTKYFVRPEPTSKKKATPTDNYDDLEPTQMFMHSGEMPNVPDNDVLEPSKISMQMSNNQATISELDPIQICIRPVQKPIVPDDVAAMKLTTRAEPISAAKETLGVDRIYMELTQLIVRPKPVSAVTEMLRDCDGDDNIFNAATQAIKPSFARTTASAVDPFFNDEDDNIFNLATQAAVSPVQSAVDMSASSSDDEDASGKTSPTTRYVNRMLAKRSLNGPSSSVANVTSTTAAVPEIPSTSSTNNASKSKQESQIKSTEHRTPPRRRRVRNTPSPECPEAVTPGNHWLKKISKERIILAEKLYLEQVERERKFWPKSLFPSSSDEDLPDTDNHVYLKRRSLVVKRSFVKLARVPRPKNSKKKNKSTLDMHMINETKSATINVSTASSSNEPVPQPKASKFVLKTKSKDPVEPMAPPTKRIRRGLNTNTKIVGEIDAVEGRGRDIKNVNASHKNFGDKRKPMAVNVESDSSTKTEQHSHERIRKAVISSNQNKDTIQLCAQNRLNRSPSSASCESDNSHRSSRSKSRTVIIFTRVDADQYMPLIERLRFKVVELPKEANVLVSNKVYRTCKFLSAIALGLPIISENWLCEMKKQNKLLSFDAFRLCDKESEHRFKFVLEKSLAAARDKPLFANYSILVTPNTRPPPNELEPIIICAGGRCMQQLLDHPREGDTVLAVSAKEDKRDWIAIRKRFPHITIINAEGFMMSIMQQYLNFSKYTLT